MKRIFTSALLVLSFAVSAYSVPAYPGGIKLRTPDGGSTTVYLYGDEFCHWATDASGREVSISVDGIARELPATRSFRSHVPSRRRIYTPEPNPVAMGENHFLVILVAFADKAFSLDNPRDRFSRLLNEEGYSDYGGTGSAKQYYREQSSGVFNPIFDVVGPITVSGKMADYGGNVNDEGEEDEDGSDKNAVGAFAEAVRIARQQGLVDFSDYDSNGDGYVDNIFFYYAGYNEAEGGGNDTIWPHAFGFYGSNSITYDGVKLGRYACTSELRGRSGTTMCGIGTFCHEFGHVLGLPDFYDTDYAENGSAATLYTFSLMCSGSYNNNGCSPPNLGAIERNMLGWMEFPQELTDPGHVTLGPVTGNEAYRLSSTNPGEFFLLEVRDGTGWDSYIDGKPAGMLIYHVDQSSNDIDGLSAITRWEYGYAINTVGSHPCYHLVVPSFEKKYSSYVFPGTSGATVFGSGSNPSNKDYKDGCAAFHISGIAYGDGRASFDLEFISGLRISGTVKDTSGKPLEGVTVSADVTSSSTAPARAPLKRIHSSREAQLAGAAASCVTDAEGKYILSMDESPSGPATVTFSKPYYNPETVTVSITSGSIIKDIVLRNVAENTKKDLQKYTSVSSYGIGTGETPLSITGGVYYTAGELAAMTGMRITDISFHFYGNAEEVGVFVDFGEERALWRVVPDPKPGKMNTIDISDADIRIPEGAELCFGYSLKNSESGYPMTIDGGDAVYGGCIVAMGYMYPADGTEWGSAQFNLAVSASLQSLASPFPAFGVKVIANPGGYSAGDTFTFGFSENGGETPSSTAWYFDGAVQDAAGVVLSSGRHEVKAVCTYADGHTEEIVQIIEVQ